MSILIVLSEQYLECTSGKTVTDKYLHSDHRIQIIYIYIALLGILRRSMDFLNKKRNVNYIHVHIDNTVNNQFGKFSYSFYFHINSKELQIMKINFSLIQCI